MKSAMHWVEPELETGPQGDDRNQLNPAVGNAGAIAHEVREGRRRPRVSDAIILGTSERVPREAKEGDRVSPYYKVSAAVWRAQSPIEDVGHLERLEGARPAAASPPSPPQLAAEDLRPIR